VDKLFIRNFAFFAIILIGCAGAISYSLVMGNNDLDKADERVIVTHDVISEAEQLSMLVEAMLAAQRGYIITANEDFLKEYEDKKAGVSERIAMISELLYDNPAQESRLNEIRSHFVEFSNQLEQRAEIIAPKVDKQALKDVEILDNIKNNIMRINKSILEEEYAKLDKTFAALDKKKDQYLSSLLFSVIGGSFILLIFNGFLLNAKRKKTSVEASLKDTEERFALAIDGTEDGIFDWDLKKEEVFYSGRFFQMLGYDKKSYIGTIEDLKSLIHPQDLKKSWGYIQQYIEGNLSEYRQEFRMKHQSGRWVWIQSRAKALYDHDGNAYRMVGAHTDITHVIKERDRLVAEKDQAEDANRAKSEFLAHMSHEIRTPLTAISGIAEIFEKKKDELNDKQASLVRTLLSSTSSLKDLINDILDFSKIESGEIELDETVFHLDEVFENVISMMSLKASEKGISFVLDYSDIKNIEFYGDDLRIRQILVNLINNAIKFTDEGGVTIKADIEDRDGSEFLRVEVTDTGIGIAPENFDMVFERFKQADSSVSRRFGGTGLGLPISRNLAQLMGGDIILSSQAGKGSTFTLLIPAKYSLTESTSKTNEIDHRKLNDKIRAQLSGENKILLVEDYEGNIVVISYILEELGLEYDIAKTGVEALQAWSEKHYDIILMDIQMPEMDGFAATSKIRQLEKSKNLEHTPIIGMTAHALVGDKDKCIDAGMDSYLPKPIVEHDLKREIFRYLKEKNKNAA